MSMVKPRAVNAAREAIIAKALDTPAGRRALQTAMSKPIPSPSYEDYARGCKLPENMVRQAALALQLPKQRKAFYAKHADPPNYSMRQVCLDTAPTSIKSLDKFAVEQRSELVEPIDREALANAMVVPITTSLHDHFIDGKMVPCAEIGCPGFPRNPLYDGTDKVYQATLGPLMVDSLTPELQQKYDDEFFATIKRVSENDRSST